MATAQRLQTSDRATPQPAAPIRTLTRSDLDASLRDGWADFREKRGDLLFIGILYPLIGLVTAAFATQNEAVPYLFPIAAGLSLLGPLVSTGFYELARRREAGLDASWSHFFEVVRRPAFPSIMFVGVILLGIFAAWVASAAILYLAFMGPEAPASIGAFLAELFGTARGWGLIIVGNLVGLGFAILVLALSVVSLPMLVDDHVDAGEAMRTSVAVARANPAMVARWGLTVAVLLVIGSLPAFLGLAVVLPVLGYATWHLYTRAVDRRALNTDG